MINDELDAHAHKLAEKIRNHADGCGDPRDYWGCDFETCHYFANLIDPYASPDDLKGAL